MNKVLDIPTDRQSVIVAEAELAEAQQVADMYEAALGIGGFYREGCEPKSEPDLFSGFGIERIMKTKGRQLIVAKADNDIAGAAIIDWLDNYHCEINWLAVRRNKRGFGIGSALLNGAKNLLDQKNLVINATELVTHSLHSQASYMKDGRAKFVGFSYCHYHRVYFSEHPESTLWTTLLQGKLVNDIKAKANTIETNQLAKEFTEKRFVYLPSRYKDIATAILNQFDLLQYEIQDAVKNEEMSSENFSLSINRKDPYRYSHLNFNTLEKQVNNCDEAELFSSINGLIDSGKEFLLSFIPINSPTAISLANYLLSKGFVFHSILPLYKTTSTANGVKFNDVLGMQWVHPDIIASNPWPGETDSVIKIYGYPCNLSADIVQLVRAEISNRGQNR